MGEATFKITIFGNGGVGKTTLLHRYITGEFFLDTKVTIGLDIAVKYLNIEGKKITLQIWDFGGEDRFRFLLPNYARGAFGGIFMYDITSPNSLRNIDEWLEIFKQEQIKHFQAPLIMVGGKADLEDKRLISKKEANKIVKSYKFSHFFECSAKTGENVETIFDTLVRTIMNKAGLLVN
ncbi:MAG: Rab family GTPase [Promethearchaeota archaeon]